VTDTTPRTPSKAAKALLVGGSADTPDPGDRGDLATSPWRLVAVAAAVLVLGLLAGWGWIFIIGALTVMIFLHELGHFATAKWAGMKVTEFCILGVGPKIWSMRRGETEYLVRLVPIAAYVRIVGMNNLDECDPADEPRTFRQQSFPKRLLVMSGGSLMHFAQAVVLFVVVFAVVGVPADLSVAQRLGGPPPQWEVGEVLEGGAAAAAGIRPHDRIVSIDGHEVSSPEEVRPLVVDRAGDRVPVVVERDGRERTFAVTIGRNPDARDEGLLGVRVGDLDSELQPKVRTDPLTATVQAGRTTGEWMWETVKGLGSFATGGLGDFARRVVDGEPSDRGDGPVVGGGGERGAGSSSSSSSADETRPISIFGVARIGADTAENSIGDVLLLLAIVNISVGIINLVPLLPLDGGHIAIAVYERIRSRKGKRHMADVSRLLPLTYAVVLMLGLIMVSSVYLDIVDPIGVR
jgi:membrane-associated protease RseP (regulator of RpoE activity)